ncbi:hypothetical protein [Lewinella cohaerens]|uniref:hypothetical protein n=1 Tax=Lewinella cohaerens TaxID=70995 RepID=UPI0003764282|nr:hypothetical protein [Lewinella cohaerens]
MIKFILTGLLVYFVYRFFIAPPVIDQASEASRNTPKDEPKKANFDDEYIDYEEVD